MEAWCRLSTSSRVMTKQLKIRRVGNSCGVILPKDLLDDLGLKEGSTVTIVRTPDGLVLRPVDASQEHAMAAYRKGAEQYRNALGELAK